MNEKFKYLEVDRTRSLPNDDSVEVHQKQHVIDGLKEMFPLIPEEFFHPVVNYEQEEMSALVLRLSEMDNFVDIMHYLYNLGQSDDHLCVRETEEEVAAESDGNGCVRETTVEEDSALLTIEQNESPGCLVLGREFLLAAHKKFGKECGVNDVNIDNIPPEITEMNWHPSDELMKQIYRAFFTDLGLICTTSAPRDPRTQPSANTEHLTVREAMELDQAMENSLLDSRQRIRSDESLQMQLASLRKKFPDMSMEHLEERFIECGLNVTETIAELSRQGYISTNWISNPKTGQREKPHDDSNKCLVNTVRLECLQQRIEREQKRKWHIRVQLETCRRSYLYKHVESYWREELRQSVQRLRWLEEQRGMATVAQREVLHGKSQLDLHGLTCTAAISALRQRLDDLCRYPPNGVKTPHLLVICGRGLHSLYGRPRLKPVVQRYLVESGIHFSQPFDGTFRISLRRFVKQSLTSTVVNNSCKGSRE